MDRRQFIAGGAALAGVLIVPKSPLRAADGFLELRARRATAPLLGAAGPATDVWSYNGVIPGPIVRVARGDKVRVRLINELDEPTTIHWHGIRIENAMDGVAGLTQEPVMPGDSFDYVFTAPDAGTYWYHSHNKSWEQMARGLYGQMIIDGDAEEFATDHLLMIDDWRLNEDGSIHEQSFGSMMDWSHAGRLGNWVTVNGISEPELKLSGHGANRLRLINASNARIYEFVFEGLNVRLFGLDGQVFDKPRAIDGPLVLGPAQRADLVAFKDGNSGAELIALNGRDRVVLARFRPEGAGDGPADVEAGTPVIYENELPEPDFDSALKVNLVMEGGAMGMMRGARIGARSGLHTGSGGRGMMEMRELVQNGLVWAFNGVAGMPEEPLFKAISGQSVHLTIVNETQWPHSMHLHGHHFRVLSRNGQQEPGQPWRDTVNTAPAERVEIAFVADNPGNWLLHCHMAEHMAAGMMTWFEVS